ncbi:IclR family transcriptional regulator [Amycolatopsis echigonensis]|jgi:IclR family acetate operon transcriptional repressor|uniref:IclR family transcriptional regulator n=1 Tax=Amycolatopsis echigonensis TaxID=2576905 RepID=A0A8E2B4W8_9PSEU|nr:IclR family transcriptional regulator [Amycolatopsis echigonensis]MBB2502259.1 IclR family transcriptional regulator [Amycolatopsis echigonensis]
MAAEPTLIGSVQRALHLLDAVGASERPVPAKVLARTVGLPLPTTYHLLRTLVHEGYLCKLDDGYALGSQVSELRQHTSLHALLPKIRPVLRALRDEVHGAAYLSLYSDGDIKLVDIADGPAAPSVDLWVGVHESAHATAFGKCILSGLDSEGRRDYLSRHQLADLTPHTITDSRVLEQRLSQSGDVFNDREEYLLGTACLATSVRTPGALGAVAISLPARRLGSAPLQSLRRAAQRVSRALAVTH